MKVVITTIEVLNGTNNAAAGVANFITMPQAQHTFMCPLTGAIDFFNMLIHVQEYNVHVIGKYFYTYRTVAHSINVFP